MSDLRAETADLLAEKPELEGPLSNLLAIDDDGHWDFDDVPLDSGEFGEIVSRGIVTETDNGGYRIADRTAVRAALDGETPDTAQSMGPDQNLLTSLDLTFDWRMVAILGAVLAAAFAVRVVPMTGSVFRSGEVVLAANDPWFYRHWLDQLTSSATPSFGVGGLSSLPASLRTHDVFMIAVLWGVVTVTGGEPAVGHVLAWYPPVAGTVTVLIVYALTTTITDDRRVGVAAALLLGVTPAHAFRTALGFADHHAFDFVWVAVTAYALVVLFAGSGGDRSLRRALATTGLGVGVASSVLAWRGGILFLLPVGAAVTAKLFVDVASDRPIVQENAATVGGLAIGAFLSACAYLLLSWTSPIRAFSPALLAAGVGGLLAVAAVGRRIGVSLRAVVLSWALTGTAVSVLAWVVVPGIERSLAAFFELVRGSGQNIAETYSLFSGSLGSIAGPLLLFGFVLYLALPYQVWAVWRTRQTLEDTWLVVLAYVWILFGLTVVQIRFAGSASLFVAPFAGLGFVHLAAKVDAAEPPAVFNGEDAPEAAPDLREAIRSVDTSTARTLVLLFVLIAGIGVIQTPVKMNQIAVDDETYETAQRIEAYAADHGMTYPQSYVLSPWGQSRVYNYLVSGQSEGYAYAQYNYERFLTGSDAGEWRTEQLNEPVGFVVVSADHSISAPDSMYRRLYVNDGSRTGGVPGLGTYRLVSVVDDTKGFAVVRGARLTGQTGANETVAVTTNVTVDGYAFTYRRQVTANATGYFAVRVSYPGTYQVVNGTVGVPESAVHNGQTIQAG